MPGAYGRILRAECAQGSTARRVSSSMVNGTTVRAPSNHFSPPYHSQQLLYEMINRSTRSTSMRKRPQTSSRAIQLFEPPADAGYTIESTSRIVDVPRRTLLVNCKHPFPPPPPARAV